MELCGRHYATGRAIRLRLVNGSIVGVVALDGNDSPGEKAAEWPWVAPGLLDIQVNGYGGQEFSSPGLTVEKAAAVIGAFRALWRHAALSYGYDGTAGGNGPCPGNHRGTVRIIAQDGAADTGHPSGRSVHLLGKRGSRRTSPSALPAARLG